MAAAGDLRHRVTIQAQVETKTARGGFSTATPAVLYARVPSLVESLTGRELDRQMQIDPRIKYAVSLRWISGIKAEQTVVYHSFDGDRTLEIVQPPVIDEKARMMTLMCGEATV